MRVREKPLCVAVREKLMEATWITNIFPITTQWRDAEREREGEGWKGESGNTITSEL